ncbi:hypothetical protein F5144DRAFT_571411 [Chaetomium tenue]|uniref:Uncharacterized protein n=1 Tax=Chaetomium tenue TaxID=1854479 RepID=A0ACB7P5M0_9PEZI|nr:hypothetical protein F5144DRAFT_571411 [Chaetomium globosum]
MADPSRGGPGTGCFPFVVDDLPFWLLWPALWNMALAAATAGWHQSELAKPSLDSAGLDHIIIPKSPEKEAGLVYCVTTTQVSQV